MLKSTKGLTLIWSRDGKRYAYSKDGRIYTGTIDGGEPRQIAGAAADAKKEDADAKDGEKKDEEKFTAVRLSARGERLVASDKKGLWIVDTASGEKQLFLMMPEDDKESPRYQVVDWSPDGGRIYFADAESSAIRYAVPAADVRSIVGTGLFDFGDHDGAGDDVRLQHAQGIAWWARERKVLIADTYNHRIKALDPYTREVRTLAGAGQPGLDDGGPYEAHFWEPGGIAITPSGARAYVADTNNHALRVIDLATARVRTVALAGAENTGAGG